MAAEATTMSAAELWLELLQQVAGRSAHEIKGALNGVAVNLEVVRSRAENPEAPASRVASFAESASGQLEALIRMNEALLALTRAPRGQGNVLRTLRALGALLAPAAEVAGKPLVLQLPGDGNGETAAEPFVVRALLASALLAAAESAATVSLAGPASLDCTVTRHDGLPLTLDSRAAELAAPAGTMGRSTSRRPRVVYALAEYARTQEGFGTRGVFRYESTLAEATVGWRGARLSVRGEQTERPESERLLDAFRTPPGHGDFSIIGVTRWRIATVHIASPAIAVPMLRGTQFVPFAEVARARADARRFPAVFEPASFYGNAVQWSLSAGVRLHVGEMRARMGRYGVLGAWR